MAKLKFTITMSLDGYVAGPRQSLENPLGEGGVSLHEWAFATRFFRSAHGMEGGEAGLDDDVATTWGTNIGATIMGRNMFRADAGLVGQRRLEGWWGDDPPFHTPVFVLTHHPREPIEMEGGTTFHFSPTASKPPSSGRWRRRAARTSPSAAAPMWPNSTCAQG